MQLLTATSTDLAPSAFLADQGDVFAVFDQATQDSGNVSFGVDCGSRRFFVKTAGTPDDPRPLLSHRERVELLRNAIHIGRSVSHPALAPLNNVIESPAGPLLVYDWVDGELIGGSAEHRADERSAFSRFRRLTVPTIVAALDTVFDLHARLGAEGWIAVDFYDGSLIYDFATDAMHVVDIDHYQPAPFINHMGRMFGSTRFMAPEEFTLGERIDQRTTVFTMGRTALQFLSDGSDDPRAFRGPAAVFDVVMQACRPARGERYTSLPEFYDAWRAIISNQ